MKFNYKNILIFGLFAIILILAINPMGRNNQSVTGPQSVAIVDQAIEQYKTASGADYEVVGEIRNFGCHSEIWLYNTNNELVAKYTIFQGRLQAIR